MPRNVRYLRLVGVLPERERSREVSKNTIASYIVRDRRNFSLFLQTCQYIVERSMMSNSLVTDRSRGSSSRRAIRSYRIARLE